MKWDRDHRSQDVIDLRTDLVAIPPSPGYRITRPTKGYVVPAVAQALQFAGSALAVAGLSVDLGDASAATRGPLCAKQVGGVCVRFHLSHRDGLDLDVKPRSGLPPTQDPGVVLFLETLTRAPGVQVQVIGTTDPATLVGRGLPGRFWSGHDRHVHVRFRLPALSSSTRSSSSSTWSSASSSTSSSTGIGPWLSWLGGLFVLFLIFLGVFAARRSGAPVIGNRAPLRDLGDELSEREVRSLARRIYGRPIRGSRDELLRRLRDDDGIDFEAEIERWRAAR